MKLGLGDFRNLEGKSIELKKGVVALVVDTEDRGSRSLIGKAVLIAVDLPLQYFRLTLSLSISLGGYKSISLFLSSLFLQIPSLFLFHSLERKGV